MIDPIDFVCSRYVWRRHPSRIYYGWRRREHYHWIWRDWTCVLPWGLKVALWNWLFRAAVDWRAHGPWLRWHWRRTKSKQAVGNNP